MINKEAILKHITDTYNKIKDTKYLTTDINERLALSRMEVANLRAALLSANDGASAEIYAAKLCDAQKEYMRILKISRQKKIV